MFWICQIRSVRCVVASLSIFATFRSWQWIQSGFEGMLLQNQAPWLCSGWSPYILCGSPAAKNEGTWGQPSCTTGYNWDKQCDKAKSGPKVAPQIVEAAASRSFVVFHAWHIQHNIDLCDLSKKSLEKVLRKCQSPCKWNQVEVRWTRRPELERRVAMSVMISKLKCIVHHETRHPECTSSPNVQYDETKDKQIGTTSTFQWIASVSTRFANSVAA